MGSESADELVALLAMPLLGSSLPLGEERSAHTA